MALNYRPPQTLTSRASRQAVCRNSRFANGLPLQGPQNAGGFTLVELMLVVAVAAILAAIAVPSFNDFVAKGRVKAAAEEIYGLVAQAKAEGPIRDTNMSVSINTASSPWCVGYAVTAGCDCTNTTACVVPVAGTNVVQVVNGTDYNNVTIAEGFAGTGPTFSNVRSTATGGTLNIVSGTWQLNLIVSLQGRIRLCNPNNNAMSGYEAC